MILKVSDLRSALVQGKILAKKGVWVSEYRIESGLNCGGHAFATDGILLGPILEEFKEKRGAMEIEVLDMCNKALVDSGARSFQRTPGLRITVQGGIGTADEDRFLRTYYEMDGTGWGSPFLLVPEATNVDEQTLQQLTKAKPDGLLPQLGFAAGNPVPQLPAKHLRSTTQGTHRQGRARKPVLQGLPFHRTPSSRLPRSARRARQYQNLKLKQLKERGLNEGAYAREVERITAKDCLCEGLGASALIKDGMTPAHKLEAVAICPGPNLAYFSQVVPLRTMVDHIHGRLSLLNENLRSHMFVNELVLVREVPAARDRSSAR